MRTNPSSSKGSFELKPKVRILPALRDDPRKEMPKKRVCAYCRVSTEEENQQSSYDLQIAYYTDFIQHNEKWEFSGIYADEGISGTSIKNRTEFVQMIEDCKAGNIDLIVTKSISRFARNTLDCLNYVRLLKGLPSPVAIYFEKENIETLDAKSELLLTILSSLAQDESRSISENTRWAIEKRFQQGKAHCPTAFFLGYDTDAHGNLVINEEQAETVRRIYREFLAGDGTRQIAHGLTVDGLKTGKGKTAWCDNSVYRILHNEKYCGDILMQKKVTLDFLTHKRVTNRGQQPQYFIADHHPAIISKEDWDAVQVEFSRRFGMVLTGTQGMSQKHSNRTVFSNLLFCGTCGEPFMRRTFTSTKRHEKYLYPVWKCRGAEGRIRGVECHARSYREEAMEHAFMAMLLVMKQEPDEWLAEAKRATLDRTPAESEDERRLFLSVEITSLEERLSEVAASAMNKMAGEVYDDMSRRLAQEIDALQSEWNGLNQKKLSALRMEENLEWLIEALNQIETFDPTTEHTDFREDIFKRIVERGDVSDDGSILYELNIGVTRTANGNDIAIWKVGKR